MRKLLFIFAVFGVILFSFSQKDQELFRINDTKVMLSEFKQMYEKNLSLVEDKNGADIDSYLDLFINYKLKVKEAYSLGLDKNEAYKKEFESYKKELVTPYLYDKKALEKLVREAYDRKKTEVKVSHILVRFPSSSIAVDTSFLKSKIVGYRNRILQGEDFEKVAREVSEDPSAKINGGNLGYFSAFQMVYPFENAAYNIKKDEVSEPFITKFGFHIIKVTGKRESRGEFEVAHVLIKNSAYREEKINKIYQELTSGSSFEELASQHSEDISSAKNGGKLPRFGTGKMVEDFENEVLKLQNVGGYSAPFKTKFGWHIVKLLKNYPVPSFNELKEELTRKVKSSNRFVVSNKSIATRLKKEYKIKEDKVLLNQLFIAENKDFKKEKLDKTILSINDKKLTQKDLLIYGDSKNQSINKELYEEFKNNEIVNYFKDGLEKTNSEYRNTLLEYKEGLLLFDLMQEKIWNKASNDAYGLKEFYSKNIAKYGKELDEIKGQVLSDYQNELEKNWIEDLRKNNTIKIKDKVVKKLKKIYNQ
ncbi:peptidylprolyl isomerase [Tenacibaculum crassostreae]|uniref:peptidylprolyl isomerase n=1 Tax=Tenacibaculum crassostreae TaxID=502683 RepID=UPI0038955666